MLDTQLHGVKQSRKERCSSVGCVRCLQLHYSRGLSTYSLLTEKFPQLKLMREDVISPLKYEFCPTFGIVHCIMRTYLVLCTLHFQRKSSHSVREAFQSKKQQNLGIRHLGGEGGGRQKIKSQVSVGKSSKLRGGGLRK